MSDLPSEIIKSKLSERVLQHLSKYKDEWVKLRFDYVEDFDDVYEFLIIRLKLKPISDRMFIYFFFYHYSEIFDDLQDKLDFCIKFIKRFELEKDEIYWISNRNKGYLLGILREEWDSLRKTLREKTANYKVEDSLQNKLDLLIQITTEKEKKRIKRPKRQKLVTYDEIFVEAKYGDKVKEILSKNKLIGEDGTWIGETDKSNELAVLFYLLKEPKYNLRIIKGGDKKPKIIAFYNEFNLKVDRQGESGGYCTYGNISNEPGAREIKRKFQLMFNQETLSLN